MNKTDDSVSRFNVSLTVGKRVGVVVWVDGVGWITNKPQDSFKPMSLYTDRSAPDH